MDWLVWVVGGLVGLYLVGKFILVPVGLEVGKNYLGSKYDTLSPQKKAEFNRQTNQAARSAKTPEEEKVLRQFQDIDKWSNFATSSMFANTSNRLLV